MGLGRERGVDRVDGEIEAQRKAKAISISRYGMGVVALGEGGQFKRNERESWNMVGQHEWLRETYLTKRTFILVDRALYL